MAGGSGTRFWPLSRRRRPKQFLPIEGTRTLLQATAGRLHGLVPPAHVLVVAPAELAGLVREQMPALPRQNVLIEPAARGTAACIALAAAWIARRDPGASMSVFPADHVIAHTAGFRRSIERAFTTAESAPYLVTVGIPPTHAETGFGYVEVGTVLQRRPPCVNRVARFIEKPDQATAGRLVASGRHLWNAGMFIWSVPVLRAALRERAPSVSAVLERLIHPGRAGAAAWRAFRRLPVESIDVALMERAAQVAVVRATFDWSDVGSWAAMAPLWGADQAGNATRGDALLIDCADTVVWGGASRLVAVVGGQDLVVVDSPDALLVCRRSRAQEVRRVVDALARGRHRRLL
jgi:mannose-1-phosphate guanylyltransferase